MAYARLRVGLFWSIDVDAGPKTKSPGSIVVKDRPRFWFQAIFPLNPGWFQRGTMG